MSESESDKLTDRRLAPPFPSRQELHSTGIPRVPQESPGIPNLSEPRKPSEPVRREPPRRPRVLPTPAEDLPTAEPEPDVAAARLSTEEANIATGTPFLPVTDMSQPSEVAPEKSSQSSPYPKRVTPVTAATAAEPVRDRVTRVGAEQRNKRRRRRRLWMIIIALIVLAVVGAGGYWALTSLRGSDKPLLQSDDYPAADLENNAAEHPEVEITVEPGELGSQIGQSLVDADVVKSVSAFSRAFDGNPAASSIKPGTYTLPTRIPAVEALAGLLDETNRSENSITVNPGQTVAQIAEKMVSVIGFASDEVSAVIEDPKDVSALPKQAGGDLEGWLWPGAYEFTAEDSPAEVFNKMVEPTVAYLERQEVPKDKWEETLIRASIVEREVNRAEDMPKVARVIENRISDPDGPTRGMLQMDSTVTYGVGGTGGLPDSAAFADDNPYNTYLVKGLPVGPIASPSQEAIQAVLNPEKGDWLYFVTVNLNTGETIFTDSHEELGKLTDQLIEWCEKNPEECKR